MALLLPPLALPSRALGLLRRGPPDAALETTGPASLAIIGAEQAAALRSALPPGVSLAGDPYALTVAAGDEPLEVTLPLPQGSRAEHLDVYAWTGQSWQFTPSRRVEGGLVAELGGRPEALALFERQEEPLSLSGMQDLGEAWRPEAAGLASLWANTFFAGPEGGVWDTSDSSLRTGTALWPVIRVTEPDLAGQLLTPPQVRSQHLAALVEAAERGAHPGLVLDYRPRPADAPAYASFLAELAAALHQQGRALAIRAPEGIDPAPLGLQADVMLIEPAADSLPNAEAVEGAIRAVLGRVERSKLRLALDARSVEVRDGQVRHLGYLEALEALGTATLEADDGQVRAGETVGFATNGGAAVPTFDEQAQAFRLSQPRSTLYLTDGYTLLRRMELARAYRLGGIVVKHLLAPGMDPRLWEVLQAGAASPQELRLAYQVGDSPLGLLQAPTGSFQAPEEPGSYQLITGLTADGQTLLVSHEISFEVLPASVTYAVQSGDTLLGIALEYGVTVDQIQQANGLEGSTIYVGQELVIPLAGLAPPAEETEPEAESTSTPTPEAAATASGTPTATPTPAPTATPKPAAPPAGSTASVSFGYGIQAHMIHQDHGPIVAALKSLGVSWVKQQIPWRDFEPQKGNIQWDEIDRLVASLSGSGFRILLSVPTSPPWALKAGSDPSVAGPPGNPQDYANFMAALAARYKGKVQMYEIWNEQNLWYEWGGRGKKINAGEYVQLLALAYNAIKAVDPGIIVVSGAPTPTGFNDGDTAVDDLVYLEQMYQAGLKSYADAIGVHPSGYNNPADAQACCWSDPGAGFGAKGHRSWFFRDTMEQYRAVMTKYGDSGKRLVPTEFGWASIEGLGVGPTPDYEYAADNTEAEQAAFIVKAFQMGASYGWVGPMFLWNLNFGPVSGASDEKAQFGILRPDWGQRPAFAQLAALTPD